MVKLVISIEGAAFWVEIYEKGIRTLKVKVAEEIASPFAYSLYFGDCKWEGDNYFLIYAKVRNWNVRVNLDDYSIEHFKRIREI